VGPSTLIEKGKIMFKSKTNFDIAMSATLSATVLEEMVRKMVEEQTGKTVERVEFNIVRKSVGFDGRESVMENVMESCTVTFYSELARLERLGLYSPGTK
jgi:hypothetical protein